MYYPVLFALLQVNILNSSRSCALYVSYARGGTKSLRSWKPVLFEPRPDASLSVLYWPYWSPKLWYLWNSLIQYNEIHLKNITRHSLFSSLLFLFICNNNGISAIQNSTYRMVATGWHWITCLTFIITVTSHGCHDVSNHWQIYFVLNRLFS